MGKGKKIIIAIAIFIVIFIYAVGSSDGTPAPEVEEPKAENTSEKKRARETSSFV